MIRGSQRMVDGLVWGGLQGICFRTRDGCEVCLGFTYVLPHFELQMTAGSVKFIHPPLGPSSCLAGGGGPDPKLRELPLMPRGMSLQGAPQGSGCFS